MSMNRRQIEEIVNTVQPIDEMNEMAILGYCHSILGFRVAFREDRTDLPKVTLEQFKQYINEGMFNEGNVVSDKKRGGVGIVHSGDFDTLSLVAYVDRDGCFHEGPVEVRRVDCRIATEGEMTRLQHKLYEAGLGWNRRKRALFKQRYVPQDNQQVRLSVLGRKMGLGVFKEIDADGQIIMYCVKMEGEDARYSLHEVAGKAEDYQIDLISTYERNIFTEELKQAGVTWNGHLKQIRIINRRVEKGGTYYYLDDIFEIVSATDNYTARDTKRLVAGNYFMSPDGVGRLLKAVLRETSRGGEKMKKGKNADRKNGDGVQAIRTRTGNKSKVFG